MKKKAKKLLAWGGVLGGLALFGVGYAGYVLIASRPALTGTVRIAGLAAPVEIARDADGVPTIAAANRADLARALGFLHGQERFFQMDLLRRTGAGEISALVGGSAIELDRKLRIHRFRARADAALANQTTGQRALLAAYVQGVNAGLAALGHAPFEYTLLRETPAPWTEADSLLVVDAMYFDLQDADATNQLTRALATAKLGPAMAGFLLPAGTPGDAPLDGSTVALPPMPARLSPATAPGEAEPAPPSPGSNNFAVAGRLTRTGSAMIENDMHLSLTVPNLWYRARLMAAGGLDLVGVTLPGSPFLVVGSNRHVAWGFTDGYIESGDAVRIERIGADRYATPSGPRTIETYQETICAAHADCHVLPVRETIWGPIVAHDGEQPIAWRWTAHDPDAIAFEGLLGLENARTVREALDAAHAAGMPQQNLVVADRAGAIGWTIIGRVPRRVGLDDRMPHSWADGRHGWNGYLSPAEIPEIVDPPGGRLWTANARTLGGQGLAKLGDGGYAAADRAARIRDDLNARAIFAEPDLLAVATDDRATVLDPWQVLLLAAIDAHAKDPVADPAIAAMRPYVVDWGGRAVPDSVGYRLVRGFRAEAIRLTFGALMHPVAVALGRTPEVDSRSAWAIERLLEQRPPALVPPPFKSWDGLTGAVLGSLKSAVAGAGGLARFNWGAINRSSVRHPLSGAVPLGWLTDARPAAMAGDTMVPRVSIPDFGASERMVVSPGHEDSALFDMPGGQAGNPLSPYYLAGQKAWVDGRGGALLPGPARWRMELTPRR